MAREDIETKMLFVDSVVTSLGRFGVAGTIKNSLGIGAKQMRVYGRYAIVYLVDGSGQYRDANGVRRVTAGDMIFLFPELGHGYGPGPQEHWSEIHITFEGPIFDFLRHVGLLSDSRPIIHLEPIDYWLDILLSFAMSVADSPSSQRVEQVSEFARILTKAISSIPFDLHEPAGNWLVAAQAELGTNLNETLSLEAVASKAHLSYETFRKRFRQHVGVSPAQYRSHKRIEAARALLEHDHLTTKQIASALGFADEFCFSKRFKQIAGVSPRAYRRSPNQP